MVYAGAMTPDEKARLKALIDNPPPGSKIEAAKKFGVDLYMTLRRLEMTPTERVRELESVSRFVQKLRKAPRRA
jgi:hypothetical protein